MTDLTPYESQTLTEIVNRVAEYFETTPEEIFTPTREDKVTYKRFLVFYLAHYLFKIPVTKLKTHFDHKQHGTVINGLKRIADWSQSSKDVRNDVRDLTILMRDVPKRQAPARQITLGLFIPATYGNK